MSGLFGQNNPLSPASFLGGSSSKTDRGWQLQSASGLSNLFNWALPQAKSAVGAGMQGLRTAGSDIGSAAGFFRNLMTGNRSAVNAAVAPQANTAATMDDATRRQQVASGTARGGGTAGAAQTQKEATLARIQNMLFGARTAGASGTLEAGRAEAGVGAAQAGVGTNLASIGGTAAIDLGELGTKAKAAADAQNQQIGQSIGEMATLLLFA